MLAAVPDGCRTALDAGCGDGLLARKPAERSASVTGVDRSAEMIERARGHTLVPGNVTYRQRPVGEVVGLLMVWDRPREEGGP
ncbi:methyltransferase domain-containing protein [Streptomyces massasporeus]|uniref:class I SAM-dependent methyltransferase n=1 Tax=Streptomyces massasporeus TaxID=67324 RepID=UPI0033B78551